MNGKVGGDTLCPWLDSRIGNRVLTALFILAVPIFLITASVTWAVNDLRLYTYGFDKYDIPAVTGIEREGLIEAGREIKAYFNTRQEPLEVWAKVFGQDRRIFSTREVLHMRDVKHLIWGIYALAGLAFLFLLAMVIGGFLRMGGPFALVLSRWILWGCEATVGFIALFGLVALVAFDQLFLLFHKISFANDFWRLDPNRDYLLIMFPQGFWFDATIFTALLTIGGAGLLATVAGVYLLVQRPYIRKRLGDLLPHGREG